MPTVTINNEPIDVNNVLYLQLFKRKDDVLKYIDVPSSEYPKWLIRMIMRLQHKGLDLPCGNNTLLILSQLK